MSRTENVYHVIWLGHGGSFSTAHAIFNQRKNWAHIPESQVGYYNDNTQLFLVSKTDKTVEVATIEDANTLQIQPDGSLNIPHDPSEDDEDDVNKGDADTDENDKNDADADTGDDQDSEDTSEQDATSDTNQPDTKVTTPTRVKKSKK